MELKLIIGSVLFFFVASACGFNIHLDDKAIVGSGNRDTETRQVSGFNEVLLAGSGDLYIQQGSQEALTVEADDNVLPYIKTEVRNGRLELGFKENTNVSLRSPVAFHLTVKDVSAITLAGSGKVIAEALQSDSLTLNLPGSGDMTYASINCTSLHLTIAGSGRVSIQAGSAESEEVNLLGSGDFDAQNFKVKDASATIAGSGNLTLNASEKINARILGSGDIRYYGNPPTVDLNTAGSGKIRKMD